VFVSKEPRIKDRLQNIIVKSQNEKFLIMVPAFPEYAYQDKLKVDCTLEFRKIWKTLLIIKCIWLRMIFLSL